MGRVKCVKHNRWPCYPRFRWCFDAPVCNIHVGLRHIKLTRPRIFIFPCACWHSHAGSALADAVNYFINSRENQQLSSNPPALWARIVVLNVRRARECHAHVFARRISGVTGWQRNSRGTSKGEKLQSKSATRMIIGVIMSSPPPTLDVLKGRPPGNRVERRSSVAFKYCCSDGTLERPVSNWLVQASVHNTEDPLSSGFIRHAGPHPVCADQLLSYRE